MSVSFPHLFEPLRLRHKTLKHRLNFGAHTANMAEDGLPGERHLGYYTERARGGAAMIVCEPIPAHATGVLTRGNFRHGDDFIIGMAVSCDPDIEVALSVEALQEIVCWHDERGLIDYVTCGTGSYFDFYKLMPTFLYEDKLGAPFAEALMRVVNHARVQAESHIRTPANADSVIASGQADMVSIVRGQIADPHMAAKAMQDRPGDIRPFISCNQMCWGRRSRDYWISCLVNPSAGREFQWGGDRFSASLTPRSVLVGGAGPGGLEAARAAAARGHRVTLAEGAHQIGGQFRLAGMQPRRAQILDLLDWHEGQLERHQVDLRLNTPMEAAEVTAFGADAVVIATGSQPDRSGFQRFGPTPGRIDGIDNANVWSVEDVMSRTCRPGKRILLLDDGGNWRGCGSAWHLAEQGHAVTLLTPDGVVGKELARSAADFPVRRALKQLGVVFITDAAVKTWHGNGATIVNLLDASERREHYDALILATPNVADSTLFDALAGGAMEVHSVGDCVAPRWAVHAIYEGRKLGLSL
jgi:thioredoxin reductase